jgi:hypothetical protein
MASTSRGKANVDTVEPKTETVCPVHSSTKSRLRHSDTDPIPAGWVGARGAARPSSHIRYCYPPAGGTGGAGVSSLIR